VTLALVAPRTGLEFRVKERFLGIVVPNTPALKDVYFGVAAPRTRRQMTPIYI
jgi:hypothetical protein